MHPDGDGDFASPKASQGLSRQTQPVPRRAVDVRGRAHARYPVPQQVHLLGDSPRQDSGFAMGLCVVRSDGSVLWDGGEQRGAGGYSTRRRPDGSELDAHLLPGVLSDDDDDDVLYDHDGSDSTGNDSEFGGDEEIEQGDGDDELVVFTRGTAVPAAEYQVRLQAAARAAAVVRNAMYQVLF